MPKRNPIRLAMLAGSLVRLTRDVRRLDDVFAMSDHLVAMRTPADEATVLADFTSTARGAAAMRARPRLGRLDVDALARTPASTVGGAYARFLAARGLRPDAIPERHGEAPIEYLRAHYYETHDLWHVLVGFDTDPAGELGVQAFLLAQTRSYLPLFLMAAILLNTAIYAYDERNARMDALARGWTLGRQVPRIAGLDWRPLLARPLDEVRRELGFPIATAAAAAA